jgi:hypothetical protein
MKGAVRTIEAVVAGLIVIGVLATVSLQPVSQENKKTVYAQLVYLDKVGELRQFVMNGNLSGLEDALNRECVVRICENVNCTASVPAEKDVVVVDYYVAGWKDALEPKIVRVWIW